MCNWKVPDKVTLDSSFGEAYHTGWRKGVDSRYSVVMYNVINLVFLHESELWDSFCNEIISWMTSCGGSISSDMLLSYLQQWKLKEPKAIKTTTGRIFVGATNCIPERDSDDMFTWLRDYYSGDTETDWKGESDAPTG